MASGRKLKFDKEQALEAAMQVFWKKGYLGASLTDLTQGMGINKPSLYATFGNKESLFVQATEHYLEQYAKPKVTLLHTPDTPFLERLKNYLMAVVRGQCEESEFKGCYISLCVVEAAGEGMPEQALASITFASEYAQTMLAELFETDADAKRLGFAVDAEENALFLMTVVNGTAAMARAGKTVDELQTVIERALLGLKREN